MNPWDQMSDLFRKTYDAAAEQTVAGWRPILEVQPGRRLVLRTHEGDREFDWEPAPAESDLRILSHVPLLVYLATTTEEGSPTVDELQSLLDGLLDSLHRRPLTPPQVRRNRTLLERTRSMLESIDELGSSARGHVIDLARELRPIIDENLADAARINLDALDGALRELLDMLGREQLDQLVVLNRGNKSARIGNQVDLYMREVLGDEAADQRLVFAEGVDDQEAARSVLGRFLLDRAIGRDFFGDPMTMRTDVLSSPTREELARRQAANELPPRHPAHPEPDGRGSYDET